MLDGVLQLAAPLRLSGPRPARAETQSLQRQEDELTGTEDIAHNGCRTAVNGTASPAMYATWQGGDHTVLPTLAGFVSNNPGTRQYMRLYAAWFRCFLGGDDAACAMFRGGASCAICGDPGWADIFSNNY